VVGVSKTDLKDSVAGIDADARCIEVKKPDRAVRALEMLAQGDGWRLIRRETGVSFAGIAALKARHKEALEVRREELAADGFEVVEKYRMLLNERLEGLADDSEELKKTPLKDLTLGMAVHQDKALQALEGNKVTVVHEKSGPSLEDAMKAIQEAQKRVRGEAITVE
jgi:uncharacterized protein YerC